MCECYKGEIVVMDVGSGLVSTSPAFMWKSAIHPAGTHAQLVKTQ